MASNDIVFLLIVLTSKFLLTFLSAVNDFFSCFLLSKLYVDWSSSESLSICSFKKKQQHLTFILLSLFINPSANAKTTCLSLQIFLRYNSANISKILLLMLACEVLIVFINTDLILPFISSFFLNAFLHKLVMCLNMSDLITLSVESNSEITFVIYHIGEIMFLLVK